MLIEHPQRFAGAAIGADIPLTAERWYLVQTQVGREILADTNLERQGFRTFLPSTLRTVRHARQLRTIESAYFPGYLFVALDLTKQAWQPINGTLGVVRIFANDNRPTPVPTGVVEQLMAMVGPSGAIDRPDALAPGDTVRLTAGPFADALGVVDGLSGANRVSVLLAVMSREIIVTLPASECEIVRF